MNKAFLIFAVVILNCQSPKSLEHKSSSVIVEHSNCFNCKENKPSDNEQRYYQSYRVCKLDMESECIAINEQQYGIDCGNGKSCKHKCAIWAGQICSPVMDGNHSITANPVPSFKNP